MDFAHIAIVLVIILAAAKVLGEISERMGQPAVLGELFAGILIGPHVLGFVHGNETIEVIALLAQIGAVLLLFEVGLESDLDEFLQVGISALTVALVGVALPLVLGYGAAVLLGFGGFVPLFVGATLTATSVGITARVLTDLSQIQSKEAKTVLGAAVIDDVLGLIVLATVIGIVATGHLCIGSALLTAGIAIVFLVGGILIGIPIAPYALKIVRRMRTRGVLIAGALIFCLFMAWAAEQLRLAAIVGAFAAGLVLAKTEDSAHISTRVTPMADIFVPIFFVWLGFAVNPAVFNPFAPGGGHTLLLVGVLFLVAIVTKSLAGFAVRSPGLNNLAVGIGMIPRGEVGLIFASLGLREGIIQADLYAVVVTIVVLTTVVTPPLLTAALRQKQPLADKAEEEVVLK